MNTPPVGRKEVQVVVGLWNNETVVKAIKNEIARDGQVISLGLWLSI
jgi:transcription-repair coupling factor (superfamily II helicase)